MVHIYLVAVTGVEPVTFRVWTERSSQLSYTATIKWCPEAESNHRHGDFQSPALPTELSGHLAERVGFEPTVPLSITGFQDQLLKPLGHLSRFMVTHRRFELRTPWLKVKCSTDWANGSYSFHCAEAVSANQLDYHIIFARKSQAFFVFSSHCFHSLW